MRARHSGALLDRLDAVGLLHGEGHRSRSSSACCARGRPSSPATRPRWWPSTRSDGDADPDRRRAGHGRAVRPGLRARAPAPADGALRAAVAVLQRASCSASPSGRACSRTSPRRSASTTRRRRCSSSPSASRSPCCCTSRWSSRAWPTRTRCWPSAGPAAAARRAAREPDARAGRRRARRARLRARARRHPLTVAAGPAVAVVMVCHDSAAEAAGHAARAARPAAAGRRGRGRRQRLRGRHGGCGARGRSRARSSSRPARTSASPAAATPARGRRARRSCSS